MYSDEVIYLWRLLQPSNQYRRHKCRYWCQCKSAGSGSFAILLTCFVWMEMLIQLWRQKFRVGTNSGSWYHCLPIGIFHFLLRSGRTVLTMTGFVCGDPDFSKKFGTGDYVGDSYSQKKLVAHQSRGGACGHIREI